MPALTAEEAERAAIAHNLRQARKVAGLTQMQLALAARCSRTMITKIETGHCNLTLNLLWRLARALNTTPCYLLGGWET